MGAMGAGWKREVSVRRAEEAVSGRSGRLPERNERNGESGRGEKTADGVSGSQWGRSSRRRRSRE